MTAKLITAATEEPVSLAECRAQCNIDHAEDDFLVIGWMRAAREYLEQISGRAFLTSTWEVVLPCWPCDGSIRLPLGNLQSVTSVKYYGTDDTEYTLSSSAYYVETHDEPGRIVLKYTENWPSVSLRPSRPIVVRFVCGWATRADVPESLKAAIRLVVGHLNKHREAVLSGSGTSEDSKVIAMGVEALTATWRLFHY